MLVKYKPISIKTGRRAREKMLNKTVQKVPTSPKIIMCSNYIGKNWSDRLSCQRSTYMYILINHWIATNTTGVIVSKIVKHAVNYIIFILHAWNVHLQRILRFQMLMNWDDASKTSEQSDSRRTLNASIPPASTCWRQTFPAYDAKMMWLTTSLTIFETTTSRGCSLFQ